jgi:hypothetical protein
MSSIESGRAHRSSRVLCQIASVHALLLGLALTACGGESPTDTPTVSYEIYHVQNPSLGVESVELTVGSVVPLVVARIKQCGFYCPMEFLQAEWSARDTGVVTLQAGTIANVLGGTVHGVYVVGRQAGKTVVTAHVGDGPTRVITVR